MVDDLIHEKGICICGLGMTTIVSFKNVCDDKVRMSISRFKYLVGNDKVR